MAGQQQQQQQKNNIAPPNMQMMGQHHKVKAPKLPPLLRFLLYGFFMWVAITDICYATGFWTHKGDNLDDLVAYSAGIGSIAAIVFLYLSLLWLEQER